MQQESGIMTGELCLPLFLEHFTAFRDISTISAGLIVPRPNQDGSGKKIVYRTSVNPWNVLFGGQSNLQQRQIIDAASPVSRGLCQVLTQTLLWQHEKKQLEPSEVLDKQHMAPAGKLLLARPPNSLKYHSPKLFLGKVSTPY